MEIGGAGICAEANANGVDVQSALAKLMYVMRAPVEKFVRTLAEPHAKMVRTVAAIKEQKEQQSA